MTVEVDKSIRGNWLNGSYHPVIGRKGGMIEDLLFGHTQRSSGVVVLLGLGDTDKSKWTYLLKSFFDI